jgi:hypothetical protein
LIKTLQKRRLFGWEWHNSASDNDNTGYPCGKQHQRGKYWGVAALARAPLRATIRQRPARNPPSPIIPKLPFGRPENEAVYEKVSQGQLVKSLGQKRFQCMARRIIVINKAKNVDCLNQN